MTFQRLAFFFFFFLDRLLLSNSLLAMKEQKQDLHEALRQMLCGCITLLLVHVQDQQLTRWMVLREGPPCQTAKSLIPFPGTYEIASGTQHSPSPVSLHLPQQPATPSHGRLLGTEGTTCPAA